MHLKATSIQVESLNKHCVTRIALEMVCRPFRFILVVWQGRDGSAHVGVNPYVMRHSLTRRELPQNIQNGREKNSWITSELRIS
jgi:hypothetical protein